MIIKSLALLLCCLFAIHHLAAQEEGEAPAETVRQPCDLIGYTHTAEGIAKVVKHARDAEAETLDKNRQRFGLTGDTKFVAGISPHDDYLYAQQVYIHLFPWIKARHVILIGVAHRARNFPESEGKLVFDSHSAWHGPYGDVPISPLRADLLAGLPEKDVHVSDELHKIEHSLEGLIPFLQHYNRDVSIVPVLAPYMSLKRLHELAEIAGEVLCGIMKSRGLSLGRDVAILISSDSVHYGDKDWGGKCFADFGVDGKGYDQAVARDLGITASCLEGELSLEKISNFYRSVVADDFHEYKVTWCGRFSIPLGLALLHNVSKTLYLKTPRGALLRYGTTLDPGRSDPGVSGLDVTANANLHHWVGFVSLGYR